MTSSRAPHANGRGYAPTLLSSTAAIAILLAVGTPPDRFFAGMQPAAAQAAETQRPAGFADLVARVKPAVISVRVKMGEDENAESSNGPGRSRLTPDERLEKFFQQFGFDGTRTRPGHRRRMITGEGSGFFISADGYAVTNYHVVDHANSVRVTTDDGTAYDAQVIGKDQKTDLALIKVDPNKEVAFVQFSDQPARIGDWVVAVGNPFGLGGTVTAGIVSATGRDIGAGPYDDFIQIDAPINKGNSGGPAFDANGRVIAVNTAIYSPSGGSVGIGFGIPAATAKNVVMQLKDKGHVTRGWIGIEIQPVTPAIADSLGLKQAEGALVAEPQTDSPAAKAGIKSGDVITSVDGAPVKNPRTLARQVSAVPPGTSLNLSIMRDGKPKTVTLTIGTIPDQQQPRAGSGDEHGGTPRLGLSLAPAREVAGAGDNGVVVTDVDPDGPAQQYGFQAGDTILAVAGKSVTKPSDVRQALADSKAHGKHTVMMRVKSDGRVRFVAVPLDQG